MCFAKKMPKEEIVKEHFGCLCCWHLCGIIVDIFIVFNFYFKQYLYNVNYIFLIISYFEWFGKYLWCILMCKFLGNFYCNLYNYLWAWIREKWVRKLVWALKQVTWFQIGKWCQLLLQQKKWQVFLVSFVILSPIAIEIMVSFLERVLLVRFHLFFAFHFISFF